MSSAREAAPGAAEAEAEVEVEVADDGRAGGHGWYAELHGRLRREQLFVTSERALIRDLYKEINTAIHQLMALSRLHRLKVTGLRHFCRNRLSWADWKAQAEQAAQMASQVEFVNVGAVLSSGHADAYTAFIQAIFAEPHVVAELLFVIGGGRYSIAGTLEQLTETILGSVYGNYFGEDEQLATIAFLEALLRLQMDAQRQLAETSAGSQQPGPGQLFREPCTFTHAFGVYTSQHTSGCQAFLVAALRDSVLAILAEEEWLGIDPIIVWSRFDEQRQANVFGSKQAAQGLDLAQLLGNDQFWAALQGVYDRLIALCRRIIDGVSSAISLLPYPIRWLAACIAESNEERELSSGTATRPVLSDLLFLRWICPAVASPEPHGLATDVILAPKARHNLRLVAKVLRTISRGTYDKTDETHLALLYERLDEVADHDIQRLFSAVVDVKPPAQSVGYPPGAVNFRGRRHKVGVTLAELRSLQTLVREFESIVPKQSRVAAAAATLPSLSELPEAVRAEQILLLDIDVSNHVGGLVAEGEILKRQPPMQDDTEETESLLPEEVQRDLEDAADKLRTAFAELPFALNQLSYDLLSFVEREWRASLVYDERAKATQLNETLRSLRALPAALIADRADAPLYLRLCSNYRRRKVYVNYLVSTRQSLMVTQRMIRRHTDRAQHCIDTIDQYHVTLKIRRFLRNADVADDLDGFVRGFRELEVIDEKSHFTSGFIGSLSERLGGEPDFAEMTEPEFEEACTTLERRLFEDIYRLAMFPNVGDDMKDELFRDHIASNLSSIQPGHSALQVPVKQLKEAPWPAAQEALQRLGLFHCPTDKVQCIVDCCTRIIDLLQLGGVSASADDLFPVLVFVILKANPPNLLSTIQFVTFFGEASVASGEAGYWWAQFCTAVHFIRSLNDKITDD